MVVDGSVVVIENIVMRPVFFARAIIITAYMPIFTLQSVEGRLFKPMAWTASFALLGALTFSLFIAPVFAEIAFRKSVSEWRNPVMDFLRKQCRTSVRWALQNRPLTLSAAGFSSHLSRSSD
jgi:cobalt-zinc-cadmium resistance protein CzcA